VRPCHWKPNAFLSSQATMGPRDSMASYADWYAGTSTPSTTAADRPSSRVVRYTHSNRYRANHTSTFPMLG